MSVTPMATYVADNLYSKINSSTVATETTADETKSQTKEANSTSEDRVTFSAGLSLAQTRESIGLNPTGKLKLKDLENVVQDRKDFVSATLTQTIQSLGIKLDQEISLSMDSKNNIIISGDFHEKSELEDVLNENENFTTAFKQLSANQSILDQISQLQSNVQNIQVNIIDYFSSDTDFNNLLALADEYESLKDSDNKMKSFLDLSCTQHPYSYTYAKNDDIE
jgi:hypothetical protein